MTRKATHRLSALTVIELLVVMAVLAVLVSMLLPSLRPVQYHSGRHCGNNLRQIGVAYRLWADDNGNSTPATQSVAEGGWSDLLTNANQGMVCFTNYAIMQNELGQSPTVVVCPEDERVSATSFGPNFDNTNVSYFVGVSASDAYPQSIKGGDRNLGPGTKPDLNYGLSPTNGKGNDAAIPISGPVSWSLKMHTAAKPSTPGNFLFGDGSVQQSPSKSFRITSWTNTTPTTNWPVGHTPAVPSIRLVFP